MVDLDGAKVFYTLPSLLPEGGQAPEETMERYSCLAVAQVALAWYLAGFELVAYAGVPTIHVVDVPSLNHSLLWQSHPQFVWVLLDSTRRASVRAQSV